MTPVSGSEKKQVLHFCALGAEEMQKFVEDLKESIAEVTELEQIRIECKEGPLIQFTLQCHDCMCLQGRKGKGNRFFRNRGKRMSSTSLHRIVLVFTDRVKKQSGSVTTHQQEKWKNLTTYDAYETGCMIQWPGIAKLRLSDPEDSSPSHTPLTVQI